MTLNSIEQNQQALHRRAAFLVAAVWGLIALSHHGCAQEPSRSRGLVVSPDAPAPVQPAKAPAVAETTSDRRGATYALVVGVGDYYDNSFTTLPNAVRDASDLRNALTREHGAIPGQNVVLMTSEAPATVHLPAKSAIMAVLKTWSEMVGPDDTFLFYFAGHGILEDGELYLVPMDGFLSTIEESAIPYRRIEEVLAAAGVSRAVSLLDACHSGGGSRSLTISNSPEFFDKLQASTHRQVVFASCRAEEISREIPERRHGAFTWFLTEGLRGRADLNGDSAIMLGEVLQYTQTSVPEWASSQNLKQNPTLIGHMDWDLLMATMATPAAPVPDPASTERDSTSELSGIRIAKHESVSFSSLAGEWTEPWLPRMQPVSGGSFRMGSTSEERRKTEELIRLSATSTQISPKVLRDSWRDETLISDGSPAIEVGPFAMSVYEITNAQYAQFVRETGHRSPANDKPPMDDGFGYTLWRDGGYPEWLPLGGEGQPRLRVDHLPVVNVSVDDAESYCNWLSKKTGGLYRLPTEIEWEYAAKSGKDARLYPWGDAWRAARSNAGVLMPDSWTVIGNDDDGYLFWAPVNAFDANQWGLCNMAGNVMEWCVAHDRKGYIGRGGGWRSTPADVRISKRYLIDDPRTRSVTVGFRIVRDNR